MIVSEEALSDLPPPVRRSLRRAGVVGRPVPSSVLLKQTGEILLRDRWYPFKARERYAVATPGFVWRGVVRLAGLPLARAHDSLADGRGRMHVRLFGLKTVVDESGPEMDQGSLMRWLNETMWFPHVWATDVLSWHAVDDCRAIGSVSTRDTTVEAEFVFDDDGRLIDFRGDRYRSMDDGMVLTAWSTPISEHAVFAGIEIPASGAATWDADDEYIRIRLTEIRYR